MSIPRYIILLVFAATGLTGCSDSSSTQQPASSASVQELFPLSVGNEWRYDEIRFNSDWSIKAHDTATFSVIDSLIVSNRTYYQIVFNGVPVSYYYYVGTTDLYSVPVPGGDDPFHFLHVPIEAGKEFMTVDTTYFDGTDSTESKEILNHEFSDLPTVVPAGSFPCEKYTLHEFYGPITKIEPSTDVLFWYSKGVGWIKRETYIFENGTKNPYLSMSLISYHFNK